MQRCALKMRLKQLCMHIVFGMAIPTPHKHSLQRLIKHNGTQLLGIAVTKRAGTLAAAQSRAFAKALLGMR